MTVTAQTTKYSYIAGGSTTTFAYQCQVLVSTDLKVYANGVLQTSGYTVTGIGVVTGGSVVFSVAPAATTVITLERVLTLDRQTDYQYGGPLSEATIDADQDRQSQIDQQLSQKFTQALLAPDGEATSISLQLPSVSSRASKYLGFDALGNAITYSAGAPSGTVLASNVSYTPPGGNATTVAQYLDNRAVVSIKDFGAVGDGVTDDSAAIQAALDYASSDINAFPEVYAPPGDYIIGATVYLPMAINFRGAGNNFVVPATGFQRNTVFRQKPAFNGDLFRFRGATYTGGPFWWGRISDFALIGNTSNTGGYGLNWRDSSSTPVKAINDSKIENISFRKLYDGGMNFFAGLPVYFINLTFHYNNGPGINFRATDTGAYQSVSFINLSGDANVGGLLALENFDERYGTISIFNLKSESIYNYDYGSTSQDQEHAIVLTDCSGLCLSIYGATHISATPDGANYKKPGSLFYITDTSEPNLTWDNVAIRVRPTDTGADPYIVNTGNPNAVNVPYTSTSGSWGVVNRVEASPSSSVLKTFGHIGNYKAKSVESTAMQVGGSAPAFSLYEDDEAADTKMWLMNAGNGFLYRRTVTDAGVSNAFESVSRSGGNATKISWSIPAQLPSYTVAGVPSAASMGAGAMIYVSNEAGGATLAFSDAANWRRVADRAVIS